MELTASGMFDELNKLPWGKFTDKQRVAALRATCLKIAGAMIKAGVKVGSSKMTDAQRREELVAFFDEKLQSRELSAAEVREMVSLCGLDKKEQDILLELVDFSKVDWENEVSDAGVVVEEDGLIETESKEEGVEDE